MSQPAAGNYVREQKCKTCNHPAFGHGPKCPICGCKNLVDNP